MEKLRYEYSRKKDTCQFVPKGKQGKKMLIILFLSVFETLSVALTGASST